VHFQSRSSYEHTPCRKLRSRRNKKFSRCGRLSLLKNGQQGMLRSAGFNCARIMWKHVADATRSSAPAFSSVQRSTPKLHRQTTGKFENERPPIPHPASQPLKVKRLSATDGPFTRPAHRTIVIHLSWNCSVVGAPNSHRIGTLIAYLRFAGIATVE